MRKWQRGVGINDAKMLTRTLCMYPGYLKVVVLADMTVETYADWSVIITRVKSSGILLQAGLFVETKAPEHEACPQLLMSTLRCQAQQQSPRSG